MTAWEKGWLPAPPRRYGFRARRAAARLEPPTDGPAVAVWHAFDEGQRRELQLAAADGRTSDVPARAVVVAALQRQLERRRERWLFPQLALALGIVAAMAALLPEVERGVAVGMVAAGLSSLQEVRLTRARRDNEQLARDHGYPVPEPRDGRAWGFDRPVLGDPLLAVSLVLTAVVWSAVWRGAHPVARVLVLPFVVVSVGHLLVTVRAFVRGLRDPLTRRPTGR